MSSHSANPLPTASSQTVCSANLQAAGSKTATPKQTTHSQVVSVRSCNTSTATTLTAPSSGSSLVEDGVQIAVVPTSPRSLPSTTTTLSARLSTSAKSMRQSDDLSTSFGNSTSGNASSRFAGWWRA
eukprot:4702709-Pleurochrysis_carterae.AAC.1